MAMPNVRSPDIERAIGDLYLLLHRENYLDEPGTVRETVRNLGARLTDEHLLELLSDRDWRPRIVGIYCVLGGRRKAFEGKLRGELTREGYSALRRPACLALLAMNTPGLAADLSALLERPLDPEDVAARAAVLEALRLLDDPRYDAHAARTRDHLSAASLASKPFEDSRCRFAVAVKFWR